MPDPDARLPIPDSRSRASPASLLPLSEPVFQILLTLADGPRHGYGVMQEVDARTDGRVSLGPGTLYGAIKRLRRQGLVEEDEDAAPEAADERRRYYRLTRRGRDVARLEAARLEGLLDAARSKRLVRSPT
ncbi:MAG: PadR family transcriptional regulator [Longimicrobiales bacterium]